VVFGAQTDVMEQRSRRRRPALRRPRFVTVAALVLTLAAAACNGEAQGVDGQEAAATVASEVASEEAVTAASAADAKQDCPRPDAASTMEMFELDPDRFSNPTVIDATHLPMTPGTQHVYEGQAFEDDEEIERKVIFTVTDLTKTMAGVESVVIWEQDYNDDELVEAELGFFAQDDDGNVWHTGEYYELWEEGEFVGGRMWYVGAPPCTLAGIQMWADPRPGMPTYSQGFAPAPFFWADRATIEQFRDRLCVPAGCFTDVLVTAESDEVDPDAVQLKFYAPDVGGIAVGWRGDDPEMEELKLVERTELDEAAMRQVRDAALAMERRAYVYGETAPAERRAGGQ
jgi:hypothetical protein